MKAILALIINRVPTGQPRRCRLPAIFASWLPPILGREIADTVLAFPRILGIAFNPITIYLCYDAENRPCFYVYEVHNTFGDAHSYISVIDASGQISCKRWIKSFMCHHFLIRKAITGYR